MSSRAPSYRRAAPAVASGGESRRPSGESRRPKGSCRERAQSSRPPLHHHQEVVAEGVEERPSGRETIQPPESLVHATMALAHGGEIRRRRKYTESATSNEPELLGEGPIQLARRVVPRPHGPAVHADRHGAATESNDRATQAASDEVVRDLPRTEASDDCEHERTSRPHEPRALACRRGRIGNAVERTEIRVRAVVAAAPFDASELVGSDGERAHTGRHLLEIGTLARARDHARG